MEVQEFTLPIQTFGLNFGDVKNWAAWQDKKNEPLKKKNDEDETSDSGSSAFEKAGDMMLTTGEDLILTKKRDINS